SDTGHQAAGEAPLVSSTPPTERPRSMPMPSAVSGARVQWSSALRLWGEVLCSHARIRREAPGGEDDTARGLERASALRSLGDDGRDSSCAVLDEVVDAVFDPDVDAEVDRRLHETPGEGDTVDEVHALTGRGEVEGIAKYTLGRMPPPVWFELRGGEESLEVGPGHDSHPEERRLPILRSHDLAQAVGEGPPIDGFRPDRAMTGPGVGPLAVDIADLRARHELECGLVFEERHHLRRIAEEGIGAFFVVVVTDRGLEIGLDVVDRFVNAVGAGEFAARGPHPSARP